VVVGRRLMQGAGDPLITGYLGTSARFGEALTDYAGRRTRVTRERLAGPA
jgi:hypothetical protein